MFRWSNPINLNKPQTMKLMPYIAQSRITRSVLVNSALVALVFASIGHSDAQMVVPVNNPSFTTGTGGEIAGQLTLLGPSATVGPQQLGTTGWYGLANATNAALNLAGFRPEIGVNTVDNPGVGTINYALGASLGGLLGLEMPEATLWQPITGTSLLANTTYTMSLDVTTTAILDVAALTSRGFGIGITTGATTTSIGSYFADTLSAPGSLNLSLLSGTTQRMTFTFTTGSTVPGGNLGFAVFSGRGNQSLQVSLLTEFAVDNASLQAVPEPHVTALIGIGLLVALRGHRLARTFSPKAQA